VAVADVLAAVVAECGPRADDRSIAIEVESPPGLEAEVNAPLLEQALINLVDNALKYSEQGGSVILAATPTEDGMLDLIVRDHGTGIGAEHLPRLFERFYRVDKGRSRKLGGTGLGLSIVKHIVQAHGGTVAVESTLGVGSTFRVRLPASRA
jgi:two-component system phosphate regulon sensor histidine kinase PhoR